MAMVAVSEILRESGIAEFAHIRMAVTKDEEDKWVLRSLLVDVFPERWLNPPREFLEHWQLQNELNDYQLALFFAGFVATEDVRAWLANQSECTLQSFIGQQDRTIIFRIPELQSMASSSYIFGHSFDGYPMMPWPHTIYTCEMKSPVPQTSADYDRLVAPGQRLYANFPSARAKIIHGMSDPNRVHQFSDKVGVRLVTGEGWLDEVRISAERAVVHVLGTALRGSRVILTGCPEFDDIEHEVNRPGTYSLAIPCTPSQFEITLVREHMALDNAVYTSSPNPFSKIQPHVIVENQEVGSTATSKPTPSTASEPPQELRVDAELASNVVPKDEPRATLGNSTKSQRKQPSPTLQTGPVTLRVIVASPGDVQRERDCLPRVIEELNHNLAGQLRYRLELWRWETEASPGFHVAGPQGRVDDAMHIEDSQIVIGIFWRRFGTPVGDAQSGTEHELRRAIKAWEETSQPHIMIYFSQRPYNPTSVSDADQLRAVLAFRDSLPPQGFWWRYRGPAEFERYVRQHLQRYLLEKFGQS